MPSTTVALVLAPASLSQLSALPPGTAVWTAVTPELYETVVTARNFGLAVTELFPNGDTPSQWLQNHLDSIDQHHNEFSVIPAYTDLVVYGVEFKPDLAEFLSSFGFVSLIPTDCGFIASKVRREDGRSRCLSKA